MNGELARAVAAIEAGDLGHVEDARRDVIAFCAAHPDALWRRCTEGHLTASALVVDPGTGRFVVLRHRKLGRWLQPGGHADGDGDLAGVAVREAAEETGLEGLVVRPTAIDLDVHEVAPPGEASHRHLDLRFLVLAPGGAALRGNEESTAIRWAVPGDLDALGADASLRRLAERGLRAL